jgi:hypothetical protein
VEIQEPPKDTFREGLPREGCGEETEMENPWGPSFRDLSGGAVRLGWVRGSAKVLSTSINLGLQLS